MPIPKPFLNSNQNIILNPKTKVPKNSKWSSQRLKYKYKQTHTHTHVLPHEKIQFIVLIKIKVIRIF